MTAEPPKPEIDAPFRKWISRICVRGNPPLGWILLRAPCLSIHVRRDVAKKLVPSNGAAAPCIDDRHRNLRDICLFYRGYARTDNRRGSIRGARIQVSRGCWSSSPLGTVLPIDGLRYMAALEQSMTTRSYRIHAAQPSAEPERPRASLLGSVARCAPAPG